MSNKSSEKITLLTHLSYDKDGSPYIGSALPLTDMILPRGRLTGVLGRVGQAALKAEILWQDKVNALYGKPLSKVELYIQEIGSSSLNQSIDDIDKAKILNIFLAQTSLTDQLDEWSRDTSYVETRYPGDREFFRRIANNPEIINKLFQTTKLCHVRAIIWPAIDPDNDTNYIKMITLRDVNNVHVRYDRHVFNFNGDSASICYRPSVYSDSFSAHEMADEIYHVLGQKLMGPVCIDRKPFVFVSRANYGKVSSIMIEFNGSPAKCKIYVSVMCDSLVIINGDEIKNRAKKEKILELISRFLLHNKYINDDEYKRICR